MCNSDVSTCSKSNSLAYTLEAESRIDERPGLGQSSDKNMLKVEILFALFNGFSFFDLVYIAHGKAQAALVTGSGRGLVQHFHFLLISNDKETPSEN